VPHPLAAAPIVLIASLACAQTSLGPELLLNPGGESGTQFWSPVGAQLLSSGDAHSGDLALLVTNRTNDWSAGGQHLDPALPPGPYEVSAWVKVNTAGDARVKITMRSVENGTTQYRQAVSRTVPGGAWTRLRAWYTHAPQGSVSELFLYVEGPPAGVSFVYDDVSFRRVDLDADWRTAADARIEALRKSDARVVVVDGRGNPVEGAGVQAEQTRQAFPFGSAIAAGGLNEPEYRELFPRLFNWAVTENELKWSWTHPFPNADRYQDADAILAFCDQHGIPLRGHNLFWAVDQYVPSWVQSLSPSVLQDAIEERIDETVARYAGRLPHWDVNNEMLHGSFFEDVLGPDINAFMFRRAAQVDPGAMLFVNDYNIITAGEFFDYADQIQDLLNRGAPIHGIGVQGHFASNVDAPSVLAKLDALSEFGLPIWVTEFDVDTPSKSVLADELEEFYRAAYSHPSVGGILMWGFWEGRHWRPNSAIVDLDWTINAAGQRYLALMEEWTTRASGTTDAGGAFAFRGFHGDYEVVVTTPGGEAYAATLVLEAGGAAEVVVEVPGGCAADFDGSGTADVNDLLAFLGAFRAGDASADADGGGTVDVNDLLAFLGAFRAGC